MVRREERVGVLEDRTHKWREAGGPGDERGGGGGLGVAHSFPPYSQCLECAEGEKKNREHFNTNVTRGWQLLAPKLSRPRVRALLCEELIGVNWVLDGNEL